MGSAPDPFSFRLFLPPVLAWQDPIPEIHVGGTQRIKLAVKKSDGTPFPAGRPVDVRFVPRTAPVAAIVAVEGGGRTDANGEVTVLVTGRHFGAPAGKIVASIAGATSELEINVWPVEVRAHRAVVRVGQLEEWSTINAKVVDAVTGDPVAGVRLAVTKTGGNGEALASESIVSTAGNPNVRFGLFGTRVGEFRYRLGSVDGSADVTPLDMVLRIEE